MPLSLAFSPCPNDTFIFEALINRRIDTEDLIFIPYLEDVEALNDHAFEGRYDVTKISFHAWLKVADRYQILNSGGALGRGNGPLLVARNGFDPEKINGAIIAIPGEHTTANLLLSLAYPEAVHKKAMLFSDIIHAVRSGEVDAGVLIHETRFTYRERQLDLIADLGTYWETLTGHAIPLGGIAVKRSLPVNRRQQIDRLIRLSLSYAMEHPEAGWLYITRHAQEIQPDVIRAHISTFVNDYSLDLGREGRAAIQELIRRALRAGLIRKAPANPVLELISE